jgi:hypothetical protein
MQRTALSAAAALPLIPVFLLLLGLLQSAALTGRQSELFLKGFRGRLPRVTAQSTAQNLSERPSILT